MIYLDNWLPEAEKKLREGCKKVTGQKEKVMASPVMETLMDFCRQDTEFAQAVVQGGSFEDCMKAVAKGVGNAISDIEAYRKAVQFYFPGAKIEMQMTIDLIGDAAEPKQKEKLPEEKKPERIVLSLEDFL